jgi:5-methylcytosine-specific restriction endonuclease McrA
MKKETRQLVYEKYDGHCAYCGCVMDIKEMQVDHFISKLTLKLKSNYIYTLKEINDIDNLMPSCRVCNKWKSSHSLEQFRKEIGEQLRRLNEYSSNYRFARKYNLVEETPHNIVFYFEQNHNHGRTL